MKLLKIKIKVSITGIPTKAIINVPDTLTRISTKNEGRAEVAMCGIKWNSGTQQ